MKIVLVEPLVGRQVCLEGLKADVDLNGRVGTATHYNVSKLRIAVILQQGQDKAKRNVSVPLTNCVAVGEQDPQQLNNSLFGRSQTAENMSYMYVLFGRSELESDFVSIFLERARIETTGDRILQRKAGCATCGKKALIRCSGCGLCQWCSDYCQKVSVEAGHGALCQEYRALRQIFDNPILKEAAKMYRNREKRKGFDLGETEACRLVWALPSAVATNIRAVCGVAVQWPASSEIATCEPGTIVHLSQKEQDWMVS